MFKGLFELSPCINSCIVSSNFPTFLNLKEFTRTFKVILTRCSHALLKFLVTKKVKISKRLF